MKILFAGCGDIASRVAQVLGEGAECAGFRRRAEYISQGIAAYSADLNQPDTLQTLPQNFDYVLVTLTPSGRSIDDYRRAYVEASEHLCALIEAWPNAPKRIFYVSSTSVYGQTDHSEVLETSPTRHDGTAGCLVESEKVWLNSQLPTTVLRLSGIYGDSRQYFLKQVMQGTVAVAGEHYSNRIHIQDAARAIAFLIAQDATASLAHCYIVSDLEPVRLSDVVTWLHSQLPEPPAPNGETFKRRGGSKRCRSTALQDLGFRFDYPSFREGYGEMLMHFASSS